MYKNDKNRTRNTDPNQSAQDQEAHHEQLHGHTASTLLRVTSAFFWLTFLPISFSLSLWYMLVSLICYVFLSCFFVCFFLFVFSTSFFFFFFLNDTATPEISPLPLHDALPISDLQALDAWNQLVDQDIGGLLADRHRDRDRHAALAGRAVTGTDQRIDGLVDIGIRHHDHKIGRAHV